MVASTALQLGSVLCRYHLGLRARHGSAWHSTFKAGELAPYLACAAVWIAEREGSSEVKFAIRALSDTLASAPSVEPTMNLRRKPADYRARVAFARLRDAGIQPARLLGIYLGVSALIEDETGSPRPNEFRNVQAAKALHRLRSGFHYRAPMWNPLGPDLQVEIHAYPRSSGLVLREIGSVLEGAGGLLTQSAVPEIISIKTERYGPHPSHLPC